MSSSSELCSEWILLRELKELKEWRRGREGAAERDQERERGINYKGGRPCSFTVERNSCRVIDETVERIKQERGHASYSCKRRLLLILVVMEW